MRRESVQRDVDARARQVQRGTPADAAEIGPGEGRRTQVDDLEIPGPVRELTHEGLTGRRIGMIAVRCEPERVQVARPGCVAEDDVIEDRRQALREGTRPSERSVEQGPVASRHQQPPLVFPDAEPVGPVDDLGRGDHAGR